MELRSYYNDERLELLEKSICALNHNDCCGEAVFPDFTFLSGILWGMSLFSRWKWLSMKECFFVKSILCEFRENIMSDDLWEASDMIRLRMNLYECQLVLESRGGKKKLHSMRGRVEHFYQSYSKSFSGIMDLIRE